jgi:hypothetical protein
MIYRGSYKYDQTLIQTADPLNFFPLFIYSYVHTLFGSLLPPDPLPPRSFFQAEPILPFSPILLKRRHK